MKTFLEDLGKRISETAETVTSKAGEALEIQKLKGKIRTLERGNENDLIDLGYMVYEKYKEEGEAEEGITAICEEIRKREESIAAYRREINDLRGDIPCASCGRTIAKDMEYCPYCGEKKPESTAAGEKTETDGEMADAAEEVKDAVSGAAEEIKEAAADAADKVKETISDAAEPEKAE